MYRKMIGVVLRKPGLLPALLGLAWATRRRHWHRRFPFLPLPPASYLRWRLDTAYGAATGGPPDEDNVRYLAWTRRMRRDR
jgi:hypothetical protein